MGEKIDNGTYVREYYRVPACRGRSVLWRGRPARILGFDLAYLRIELLDAEPLDEDIETVVHPTWEVQYPALSGDAPPDDAPGQDWETEPAQQWNEQHRAA